MKKKLFIVFALLGIFIGANLLIPLLFGLIPKALHISDPSTLLALSLFYNMGNIIACLLSIRLVLKGSWSDFYLADRSLGRVLGKYGLGLLISLLMIGGISLLYMATNGVKFSAMGTLSGGLVALFFFGFVVQGLSEEILTRSLLQGVIKERWGIWPAMLVPSLVFSLLHLANPSFAIWPMINTFLFGLMAAILTLLSGNIGLASGFHSGWNFFLGPIFGFIVSGLSFSPSFLSQTVDLSRPLLTGGSYGPEGSLVVTVLLAFCTLVFVLIAYRKGCFRKAEAATVSGLNSQQRPERNR